MCQTEHAEVFQAWEEDGALRGELVDVKQFPPMHSASVRTEATLDGEASCCCLTRVVAEAEVDG